MEKKSRKSASKWDQASERALISIWGDRMSDLRGCRKNSHILLEMAAELQKQGYSYTEVELKTKMHNLTARYRKEKQNIGTTGGSPSEWDLFHDMQTLLAPFKSYHTEDLVKDSINDINSIIVESHPLPSAPFEFSSTYAISPPSSPPVFADSPHSSPPVSADSALPSTAMSSPSPLPSSSNAKAKKKDILSNVLKKVEISIEKSQEEMKRTSQKILQIEEEKKNILKEYVDREAEVQKALVEFLKRQ